MTKTKLIATHAHFFAAAQSMDSLICQLGMLMEDGNEHYANVLDKLIDAMQTLQDECDKCKEQLHEHT